MRDCILPDSWRQPRRADDELLMTTSHSAKFLGVGLETMRRFGLTGVVPTVPTSSARLRLFKKGDLRRFHEARAEARLRRARRQLAEVQPVMLKAGLKPRQFDLFGPKLRIVRGGSRDKNMGRSPHHYSANVRKTAVSDKHRYVNPAAAESRR
jgi:hypothetical protein